jgi:hypothetical protein
MLYSMLVAKKKNPAAVALGRKGGKARAKKLTPEEMSEQNRKAVQARWEKYRAKQDQQKQDRQGSIFDDQREER